MVKQRNKFKVYVSGADTAHWIWGGVLLLVYCITCSHSGDAIAINKERADYRSGNKITVLPPLYLGGGGVETPPPPRFFATVTPCQFVFAVTLDAPPEVLVANDRAVYHCYGLNSVSTTWLWDGPRCFHLSSCMGLCQ